MTETERRLRARNLTLERKRRALEEELIVARAYIRSLEAALADARETLSVFTQLSDVKTDDH